MYGFKNRVLETEFSITKGKIYKYTSRFIYEVPVIDLDVKLEVISVTFVYKNENDRNFDLKLLEENLVL